MKRILRNIENDRCFDFLPQLAKEKFIEIVEIPDGMPVPEVMSQADKESLRTSTVSKADVVLDDLESLHWTQLKKRVEALGMVYTNKDDALVLLRG